MLKNLRGRAWGNALLSVFIMLSACGVAFLNVYGQGSTKAGEGASGPIFTFELPVIIIDAGHGGADSGAVGVNGMLEKDINLKLATFLSREFESAGYKVVMTRTEDVMLVDADGVHSTKKSSDLTARAKIAGDGDIFISIHMNKFSEEKYKGAQVYYSVNDPASARLAEMLQRGIAESLQTDNKRAIKSGDGLYLLDRVRCPAVIVECGFLSNWEEAARLTDEEYLKQMAFEIFSATDDFVIERMSTDT